MPRAGIVTVAGRPNVGKSTLLNRIIGQKLSITSPKPQSTRDRIVGIHTADDVQVILLDTPGLLDPRYALQRAMHATAVRALAEADVILYVVDAADPDPLPLGRAAGLDTPPRAPVLTTFNKIDRLDRAARARLAAHAPDALRISARTGEGLSELLAAVRARLPEGPFLYPEDELSVQTLRFFAAELLREAALEQLDEELPYSIACEIEEFREARVPVYIRAVLYVERESQRRILIGSGGARIRSIGRTARTKIESLIGNAVYLDLWVKVLPNWRRDARALRRFGYPVSEETSS